MGERVERILIPVDFSTCSNAALSYATLLAGKLGAAVDVLHVWDPPARLEPWEPVAFDRFMGVALADLDREMDRLIEPLKKEGLVAQHKVVAGSAVEGIVREADAGNYDMIVIGTHGRTGLRRALLGSVAEAVVRNARCPVLTVHEEHAPRTKVA